MSTTLKLDVTSFNPSLFGEDEDDPPAGAASETSNHSDAESDVKPPSNHLQTGGLTQSSHSLSAGSGHKTPKDDARLWDKTFSDDLNESSNDVPKGKFCRTLTSSSNSESEHDEKNTEDSDNQENDYNPNSDDSSYKKEDDSEDDRSKNASDDDDEIDDDEDDIPLQVRVQQQSNLKKGHGSSKKKIRLELSDEYTKDPDLYGVRRSGRIKVNKIREEEVADQRKSALSRMNRLGGRNRKIQPKSNWDSSDEESEDNYSDSSEEERLARKRRKTKASQRNRKSASRPHRNIGGRACTAGKSYKEASTSEGFSDEEPGIDDITENSDDDESSQSASVSNSAFRNKRKSSRDASVASAYYKPSNKVHPLLQSGARHTFAQSSYNRASSGSGDEENRRSDGEIDDDSVSNFQSHSNYVAYTSEVDVIERVVDYRLGRKNAVGDATTIYLLKQGTDPNEGFNAELEKDDAVPQYLIKWKDWSHLHNTWESMESLAKRPADGLKKIERFNQELKRLSKWKNDDATVEEIEEYNYQEEQNMHLYEQYRTVERVIIHRDESADGTEYLVKWMGLNYAEASWEAGWVIEKLFPQQVDDYRIRNKCTNLPVPRNSQSSISLRMQKHRHTKPFKEQPKYIGSSDLKLRDYQLDGINFLLASFVRGRSVILADEMGLGKTIQTIGFMSVLYKEINIFGPFLLVVPLSTLPSWQKEFAQWAPFINVVSYIGDRISREKIRQFEWYVPNNRKSLRFNACLTTYEMILKDWKFLKDIHWSVLAVDEAHRLKNNESLLYQLLQGFNTYYRLLITGTPLQNSLHELWALLHFLMPYEFDNWDEFNSKYSIEKPSDCMNLWKLLAPYIFRRVKKQVEASLPAKVEKILRVELSRKQKQYYKWILTKNYAALSRGVKGSITGFVNIVMELKKLCNHPHLVRGEEENAIMRPDERLKAITRDSGKMLLLDKLLLRLKSRGHRVLIFSQMVRMLDILEDYLKLRGWFFQRLDGSVRGDLRKNALDHFNAENSIDFVFLLSTRAGGLGINLASADTVIIFDSDWNPQNDLQAQARAHRIGQTKQVSVYRFVQTGSVEETIIERAKKKMVLDHLVIQRMDTTGRTVLNKKAGVQQPFNKDDLNEILKFGAEEMFKEPEGEEADCPELNIDDVLNEAETRDVEEENNKSGADELLSFFQVHNFTYDDLEEEQVNEAKKAKLKESENKEKRSKESELEAKSWDDIIPDNEIQKVKDIENQELLVQLNLGPRNRKQTKLFNYGQDDNEEDDDDDDDDDDNNDEGKGKMLKDKDLRSLVRSMRRFPRPQERIEAIIAESDRLQELSVNRIRSVLTDILQKCNDAMTKWIDEEEQRKLEAKDSPDPKDDENSKMSAIDKKARKAGPTFEIGQSVTVNAKLITQAISDLEPLAKAMPPEHKDRLKYNLPISPKPVSQWKTDWSVRDDAQLLVGVFEHGMDNWDSIKMDPELDLIDKILPPNGKHRPQANHLKTRVEYLIKLLGQYQRDPTSTSGPHRGHSISHRSEKKGVPSVPRKRPTGTSLAPPRKKATIPLPSGKSREFIEDSNVSSLSSSSSDSELESHKRSVKSMDASGLHSKANKQDDDRDKKINKKKRKLEDGESGDANHSQNSKKIKKETAPVKKKKTFNDPMHFTTHEPVLVKEEIKAEAEKQRSRGGDEETLSSERFKELKDVMRPVRKILKRLETCDLKDESRTVDYVLRLGNHIRDIYHQQKSQSEVRRWRNDLWQFVSLFVDLSKEDLHNMYKRTFRAKKEKEKSSDEPSKRRYSSDERKESHHDRKPHNHRSHHHHQHRDSKNNSKSDSYHQDHSSIPRITTQDSSHNSLRPHQHYKSSYSHYSTMDSDSNSMHHNYASRDSSDFHRSGMQRHQRPTDSYNRHPQHHWGMSGSNSYGSDAGGGGGSYGWRHGGGGGGSHRPPPPTDAYNAYNRRPGHTGPHNSRWS